MNLYIIANTSILLELISRREGVSHYNIADDIQKQMNISDS